MNIYNNISINDKAFISTLIVHISKFLHNYISSSVRITIPLFVYLFVIFQFSRNLIYSALRL